MQKTVVEDDSASRADGFHDALEFRVGRTDGEVRDFSESTIEEPHKYIVRTIPSNEQYIAGTSSKLQHPISLIDEADTTSQTLLRYFAYG